MKHEAAPANHGGRGLSDDLFPPEFVRNALAYANKGQRQMILALINTVFPQESAEAARAQWAVAVEQLRTKFPKLATMLEDAKLDVFASWTSRRRIERRSHQPILSNASTPKSSGEPMSSGSSQRGRDRATRWGAAARTE